MSNKINVAKSNKKVKEPVVIDSESEDVSDVEFTDIKPCNNSTGDKVNDDSSDESGDESGEESGVESGEESGEESGVESVDEQDKQKDKQKDKPKKMSHKELTTELILNEEKIYELETKLNELEKMLQTTHREQNALRRTNIRLIKQLDKAHDDDVIKAKKEKKKRNVTEDSGILKKKPIPSILKEFLGLEQETELPRTKVMSLLSNKFNELQLRKGQHIHLDKKTAQLFGKEDKYVIEFKYFQRFLKEVYESEFKQTNVEL
jgi:hypothetical protein